MAAARRATAARRASSKPDRRTAADQLKTRSHVSLCPASPPLRVVGLVWSRPESRHRFVMAAYVRFRSIADIHHLPDDARQGDRMSPNNVKSSRRIPPPAVLVAVAALVILVPLGSWALVGLREWSHGGSPAAELEAPYFWGVMLFRLAGAFLLAALLCFCRTSASIWITVTSVWLAGPPLQMLLTGSRS